MATASHCCLCTLGARLHLYATGAVEQPIGDYLPKMGTALGVVLIYTKD